MDLTSDAAKVLKTCVLRETDSTLDIAYKKERLLQRSRAQSEGHFRARRGILFEVDFGNCRMHLPSFDWNDSSFERSDEFSIHDSDPYIRTGIMQHSTTLMEESGFKRL